MKLKLHFVDPLTDGKAVMLVMSFSWEKDHFSGRSEGGGGSRANATLNPIKSINVKMNYTNELRQVEIFSTS